jgi:hypothetical protein
VSPSSPPPLHGIHHPSAQLSDLIRQSTRRAKGFSSRVHWQFEPHVVTLFQL